MHPLRRRLDRLGSDVVATSFCKCGLVRVATACFLAAAVLLLSGCGSSVGRVSGKVTLDNQPLPGADLVFQRADDPGQRFVGNSLESGDYQVDYLSKGGLPPGRYQVTVTWWTTRDGQPVPPGEEGESLKDEGLAVTKAVTFTHDISAGSNAIDFELSKGTPAGGD